jgi:hypothetical protein
LKTTVNLTEANQFESRDQDDFVAGLFNSSTEVFLLRDIDIFGPTGQLDKNFKSSRLIVLSELSPLDEKEIWKKDKEKRKRTIGNVEY